MHTKQDKIDAGRAADWSGAAEDYAKYRPGPPESFYEKLAAHGHGLPNQRIIDIATGTGHLARRFAASGCSVAGYDIADEQITMAKSLAASDGVAAQFATAPAEAIPEPDRSADLISASQSWLYFDKPRVLDEAARVLRPGGALLICHFSFLPRLDPIVAASEAVVLAHNPDWSGADWDGQAAPIIPDDPRFRLSTFFAYDEDIPFTRVSWRGRMRALRGIAASLNAEAVAAFDEAHDTMLREIAGEAFTIKHRIDATILTIN